MGGQALARRLRVEYPGAYYHLTARGVARQNIFHGDEDYSQFLSRLEDAREVASRVSRSDVKSLPHRGGDAAGTVKVIS
jgi:hypothetical protein